MLETGNYAYVEARLTFLEAELSAKEGKEARFTLYSGLSSLIDFLPTKVKAFVEWWIMRNDFENVKDAAAQILGGFKYEFSRPFIKVRREALLNLVGNRNMHGLFELLSSISEDFASRAFEGSATYSDFAFNLDRLYFEGFNNRFPKRPDGELARMLVALRIDLLNLNLFKRVRDLGRFFLPYGFLSVNDMRDENTLSEKLFELYGVKNVDELKSYYRGICMSHGSGFSNLMGFIILHEYSIEGVW